MGATDHSVRLTADGSIDNGAGYRINYSLIEVAVAPGVANLATDIDAGPGEDRRRRHIDWRRLGGESRRTGDRDGTGRCQEDLTAHGVFSVAKLTSKHLRRCGPPATIIGSRAALFRCLWRECHEGGHKTWRQTKTRPRGRVWLSCGRNAR